MPAAAPTQFEPRSVPGCPSDDALLSFIPGLLSEDEASVVSAHVQSCSTCQSRVTTLKKRLSSHEGGPGRAAATIAGDQGQPTRPQTGKAKPGDPGQSTAATVAYVPKRPRLPERLGQYQVLGPIGRGGMGQVFKGYHPRLQRYVAIKLLLGAHLADKTAIIRLQREQAAAGRVEHENIVYAFDAGEQDGFDYLVMEYVEGIDLARLLADHGPLQIADACEIARQAALGLAHIESCGLVHRDIKPSNLMLSTRGVVKILDLGLARLQVGTLDDAEATHSGFLLGTVDYISPEQIDTPRDADVRSDLYSLGCTLFKLLTGKALYSSGDLKSVLEKLEAHRRHPPPTLHDCRPEIPEELARTVARLLEKNPANRFQHPNELVSVLAPFCAGNDLANLLRESQEKARKVVPVPPDASQPQAKNPTEKPTDTPPAKGAWVRQVGIPALGIVGSLVLIGVGWWLVGGFTSVPPVSNSDVTLHQNSNNILSRELEESGEYKWVGHRGANHVNVSDDLQFLYADSETPQIIALGKYPGGAGKIRVTINQVDRKWEGYTGVALGVRNELVETPRGAQKLMTVFQLISLHRRNGRMGKGVVKDGVNVGYGMEVRRHKVYIDPDNTNDLDMEVKQEPWVVTAYEDVSFPGVSAVEMELELGDVGIGTISLNGVRLSKLTSARVNSWFEPKDYAGPCGLYNKGHRGTAFSDIEISPLESLK